MISFGPIPSRRLGKSLGINNITSPKTCSYSCIYCQVGLTHQFSSERSVFYEPSVIFDEVQKHLKKLDPIDKPNFLTFVSNGEPTLDKNLGVTCESTIIEAYQLYLENGIKTELILGFEGTDTGFTGNALEDIINICSVHPIREDTMQELLSINPTAFAF